jgi:hypothetical protein
VLMVHLKKVPLMTAITLVLMVSYAPEIIAEGHPGDDTTDSNEADTCLKDEPGDSPEDSENEKDCTDPNRKVVFILGMGSQGLTEEECDDPEGSVRSASRNNLRDALLSTPVGEEDIIWFSYGDDAYCGEGNKWPKYKNTDTCDGIAEAAGELDRLLRKFEDSSFDIVGHSIGGMVAAYWATGGTDDHEWLSDKVSFLTEQVHSIITLDSPLKGTEFFGFRLYQTLWECEPPDSTLESYLGQHIASADCAIEGDQTLEDLTGCNDGWNIVHSIFSSPPTKYVGFVHINSTLVGDMSQLPGYWRADPPPCRPWLFGQSFNPISFIWSWAGSAHVCMLQDASELSGVANVIMTDRYDDGPTSAAVGPSPEN